jgi:hypothetical protein
MTPRKTPVSGIANATFGLEKAEKSGSVGITCAVNKDVSGDGTLRSRNAPYKLRRFSWPAACVAVSSFKILEVANHGLHDPIFLDDFE